MNGQTDQQLLRDYAERRSESAFAELVHRHVDFVFSAALRMVRDPHLAEDVTQNVFVALARSAPQLTGRSVLAGWLHRTAQNLAANTVRSDVRRRAREQEAVAMNELSPSSALPRPGGSEAEAWEEVAPILDAALTELHEPDRDALLLRYFERKSAREMAGTLGTSEEAAQKRVSRAVERLRELFAKRGVTVGGSGLATLLSAHSVQSAPAGLAATISTAAALPGPFLAGAVAATSKAMAMTATQTILSAAMIAASVMTPLLVFQRTRTKLAEQDLALKQQANRVASLQTANERLVRVLAEGNRSRAAADERLGELLRLRGGVGGLMREVEDLKRQAAARNAAETNGEQRSPRVWSERLDRLKQWLERNPAGKIPELATLGDQAWIDSIHPLTLETDEECRRAMSLIRANAEVRTLGILHSALRQYGQEHNGQFPQALSQLTPYFKSPIPAEILDRYEIVRADSVVAELRCGEDWVITEKAPIDQDWDMRQAFGMSRGASADSTVTNRWARLR